MNSMATTVSYTLLGPPEARHAAITASAPADEQFSNPKNGNVINNESSPTGPAGKTRTKKRSPTFASSGDPCLDFFFRVLPATPPATVGRLLAAAWAADQDTALRLVANLRGVRGSGKSDRESFYAAALWLHAHHPATLARNAGNVAAFGYLKDLPELLHRIVRGGNKAERRMALHAKGRRSVFGLGRYRDSLGRVRNFRKRRPRPKINRAERAGTAEERLAAKLQHDRELSAAAAPSRRRNRLDTAATAVRRYRVDPTYRFLHDRTADLFASLLADDMRKLADGNVRELSLAAKWCPSLGSSYDRSILLCEAVARRLFPRGSSPELSDDLSDEHYAYRARERLRRAALVPLRRALQLPEIFMSARAWESVVYTRVASVAMKNYQTVFLKHDGERFNAYLADVKSGKKRIAAGALLPHQIIESLSVDGDGGSADAGVADLQWQRMVDDMRNLGKLTNCVAVCDVSGSMTGLPMDVCVALGLLVSELTEDPWRGHVITFSERPEIHMITGDTLSEKVRFIRAMEWGMNTNFQAVFDKILEVAVGARLPPEKMVRRVFVFSDMEFDQASAHPWETDYEAIMRKFSEAGYGGAVPEIVFWDLAYSKAVPVMSGQKGVALVSGFSKNMLKLFLDGGGIVTPRTIMEKAIVGPEYDKLAVFD